MKVLITGAHGQVGRELVKTAPPKATVYAFSHSELDITSESAVHEKVDALGPDLIINAAAYTSVDQAEHDVVRCTQVNTEGPRLLAAAVAKRPTGRLLQLSTDFIFDGESSVPYAVDTTPNPLNVYGRTKLGGERAIRETLPDRSIILRSSWVYATHGRNFLTTMLHLMKERGTVRVVSDQIGTPTSAKKLAQAIWRCAEQAGLHGIYHWTDAGTASWFEFAAAIAGNAFAMGLLPHEAEVLSIGTPEYPTAAHRPRYSVLDTSATVSALNYRPVHWRESLKGVLEEVKRA